MDTHNEAVQAISQAVRAFHDQSQKFRINHGSTNSTRPRDHKNVVDVGHLNHILSVDVDKKTALVEPNVPMDRLVEGTLKYGLVPPVVMEFPGITVGGGYSGTSGESSSFKHGYFDRTINYVEMILADGSIITCSRTDKPDLFNGAAGALGTLGITTLVELQLITAKKYVETTYMPVSSVEEGVDLIARVSGDMTNDYVDGILFSKTSGAIITGRMTDEIPAGTPVQTFSGAWDPWFYLHVQGHVENKSRQRRQPVTEAIPLAEYLFRYDRGGFWVGRSPFKYFWIPFNRFTRWLFDDALHTRMMYTALHASGQSRQYVVQDLAVPYPTVKDFINYTIEEFNIWPLWLCPLQTSPAPTMHPHIKTEDSSTPPSTEMTTTTTTTKKPPQMLNVGLWGFGPRNFDSFVRLNKSLEHTLHHRHHGIKWLYAHTYYTEPEFWSIYDRPWYTALRAKYHATGLPDVYEKTRIDVAREREQAVSWRNRVFYSTGLGGVYGLWKAVRSGSYVAARASTWKGLPRVSSANAGVGAGAKAA